VSEERILGPSWMGKVRREDARGKECTVLTVEGKRELMKSSKALHLEEVSNRCKCGNQGGLKEWGKKPTITGQATYWA